MLPVRLLEADAGTITFDGTDLSGANGRALEALRGRMQMLLQDPFVALLDPATMYLVEEIVGPPLRFRSA